MINKLKNISIDDIPKINPSIESYFSLGSGTNEKNETTAFDYEAVTGQLVAFKFHKELKKDFSKEEFIESFLETLKMKISNPEAIDIIKKVYFIDNTLPIFSPLMYISHPIKSLSNKTKKSLKIFLQMMQKSVSNEMYEQDLNFLEKEIFNSFSDYINDKTYELSSNSYVYYLDEIFTNDFNFLLSNPNHFQQHIEIFLKFYFFVYSAQLTLNIQDTPFQEPTLKPLYFILNHEKASNERKRVFDYGYKKLIDRTRYLFPYLSLLELLSKITDDTDLKLFHLLKLNESAENIKIIDNFTTLFRETRKLQSSIIKSSTIEEALTTLLHSALEQFKSNDKKAVIDRFIAAYEKQISGPFFQSRGRAGKVLVLDQDTILLLTNLAVGSSKKIRFQDLLIEFEKRSVFFDPTSQEMLLDLYERVGNIERKSDSGDAVYVKSI